MVNELFLDRAVICRSHDGEGICGDYAASFGGIDKPVFVMSDGMGSGVKANILATLTCTILGRLLEHGIPLSQCVDTLAASLPLCRDRRMAYATFTAAQLEGDKVFLVEYDNPPAILLRQGRAVKDRCMVRFVGDKEIHERSIDIQSGDVLIFMSDGVTHSGIGRKNQDGWSQEEIESFLISQWDEERPAAELAAILDRQCSALCENTLEDDRTIAVLRFCGRKTANLLMGPPENPGDDDKMLQLFFGKMGAHLVCGGSTSGMVGRYLGKPVEAVQGSGSGKIPDMASLEGLDLVTEGIITLCGTLELCDKIAREPERVLELGESPEELLYKALFLDSSNVNIFFGTAANKAHEHTDISFENKLDAIRSLEDKLLQAGKTVKVQYF